MFVIICYMHFTVNAHSFSPKRAALTIVPGDGTILMQRETAGTPDRKHIKQERSDMKSIKSVYKIGSGPSSSHTVGPYRAAKLFGQRYPDADFYRVVLYGSLAFTGEGHGTGKAIRSAQM